MYLPTSYFLTIMVNLQIKNCHYQHNILLFNNLISRMVFVYLCTLLVLTGLMKQLHFISLIKI